MDHKMSKDRTPYKFVGQEIITYYATGTLFAVIVELKGPEAKGSELACSH
jgi:hypothetical protein